MNYEPGSYRDRDGRVFYGPAGTVFRGLSDVAWAEWQAVSVTDFFRSSLARLQIIPTRAVAAGDCETEGIADDGWVGILEHQRVPFVSYPYEWTFSMLQDAALLHLQLLIDGLSENVITKDGTAFNVQWLHGRPVFIDVASFERLQPGQAWAGYRQFCQTFLYPLFLQAYKGINFQPWLRGSLDGISPQDCRRLMSCRDLFRRGVLGHVVLHSWLQSRPEIDRLDSGRELKSAGFHKELILNNLHGLFRIVSRLKWAATTSTWSGYAEANSYTESDRVLKENFVRESLSAQTWNRVWDLGCNTGVYSRMASEHARFVVAMDADHLAVEKLYQSLKADSAPTARRILPLVNNLVDPSVGLGWRGMERQPLVDRGRPDLVLSLALIHHVVIGHGVPLAQFVRMLAELGGAVVVEFVTKQDPMVQKLLRGRRDHYSDYTPELFERLLCETFALIRRTPLQSGTRILYFAEPRPVP